MEVDSQNEVENKMTDDELYEARLELRIPVNRVKEEAKIQREMESYD